MTVILLMAVGAAICVGYLGAAAEVAVRRLHEVQAVRRTVEAVLLFSVVDSVARWTERHDALTVQEWSSRWSLQWSQIRQWLIVGLVVAAIAIVIVLWSYAAAIGLVVRVVLWLVVVGVFAGLWIALRRA